MNLTPRGFYPRPYKKILTNPRNRPAFISRGGQPKAVERGGFQFHCRDFIPPSAFLHAADGPVCDREIPGPECDLARKSFISADFLALLAVMEYHLHQLTGPISVRNGLVFQS